ncbi:MAG: LPS export ABC transporter permease LptG [Congregibacter sp.]
MRALDRYVAKTVWLSVLLVLLVIVGIDALSAFIDESGRRTANYGFSQIGRYIMLTLPGRCYEFLPFAALIGSLIGLGQLASASELVVMRAAGVSNLRLSWTVLKQAFVMAVLGFLLGEYVAPEAEQRAQSDRALALYANRQLSAEQGIWRRDERLFLHVRGITAEQQILGVSAYRFDDDGWLDRVIEADRGEFRAGAWRLSDVSVTALERQSIVSDRLDSMELPSNITPQILSLENVAPSQLALRELFGYTAFLRTQGEDVAAFELASWKKLTQPAAIAALVLVAISFVFGPLRDGTLGFRIFAGVMVGILFRLSQDLLGPASLVFGFPPLYAAIAPVVICAVIGLLLLRRA